MPKYCEYSKYEQYRIPEYFKCRQCSRVSKPKILPSTPVFRSIEAQNTPSTSSIQSIQPRNTASTSSIPQHTKPKYCEYMKYLKCFSLENTSLHTQVRSICETFLLAWQLPNSTSSTAQPGDSAPDRAFLPRP